MVKRIAMSMVEGLVAAFAAIGVPDMAEVGDLSWSARSEKFKWLKCEGQAERRSMFRQAAAVWRPTT